MAPCRFPVIEDTANEETESSRVKAHIRRVIKTTLPLTSPLFLQSSRLERVSRSLVYSNYPTIEQHLSLYTSLLSSIILINTANMNSETPQQPSATNTTRRRVHSPLPLLSVFLH